MASFLIEKTNGGYTAYSEALGILSDGKTVKQTRRNAREALAEQCDGTDENPVDYDVRFDYDVASAFDSLNVNAVGP